MKIDIEHIQSMYMSGDSVPAIAQKIGISQWSIYKAMKRHGISRRAVATSNRLRFLAQPLTFQKKTTLSGSQQLLYGAGLLLYWAEGSKRGKDTVDFTNSDPRMIQIFLRFLRRIYQINESKLRVLLYCYANQSVPKLIEYWSEIAQIPTIQFSKPYVRTDFHLSKIGRMPHGMVHIRYNDQRLMMQLKKDIEDFTKSLL